jgi:hypothetical protein
MSKPTIIKDAKKTALYFSQEVLDTAKSIAANQGVSLSSLMSNLVRTQAPTSCKVRVFADFSVEDHLDIKKAATESGMSVEDLIRTATFQFIDEK